MYKTSIDATNVREAYQKYRDGEPLTDTDLMDLHVHMRMLRHLLAPLGDTFRLEFVEALRVMEATKGYLDARREKGIEERNNYVPMLPDEKHDHGRLKPL
jgi:hypothetical protein